MSDDRGRPCRRCLRRVLHARLLGDYQTRVVIDAEPVYLADDERKADGIYVLGLLRHTVEPGRDVEMHARRDGLRGPYHRAHACRRTP